jgi:hypothetical protein
LEFSELLQQRMEILLEKKKADQLSAEETEELDAIEELDRIFTHINAMMAALHVNQYGIERFNASIPYQIF